MDIVVPRKKKRKHALVVYGLSAVTAAVLITSGLARLRSAAPDVERSTLFIDTVARGSMVREVFGHGRLVPEEIFWLTAKADAHVEQVFVKPGASVQPDTIVMELSNTDVLQDALEAEQQLTEAQAELTNLQGKLLSQRLAQRSTMATLKSELADARRRSQADEELASKGFLSEIERARTSDHAAELAARSQFEKERLSAQSQSDAAQMNAQKAQIERLRSMAEFRRKEADGLKVRAGISGVLQELPLHPGQSVSSGALLAKVARVDRLKAEVLVAETQANAVRIGLEASIDTRNGIARGRVVRIDPAVQTGTVLIDVALNDNSLPPGARPDQSIEGTIEIERLPNVLYVGRLAPGQPDSTITLFRLTNDDYAERVRVKLGRQSVKNVEVVEGLAEGDRIILSDMSRWDQFDRIHLE